MLVGFAGQVAATGSSFGLAEIGLIPSNTFTAALFISSLAVIGLVATFCAGLTAHGQGRVWALVVSGLFFTAVVVMVAGSLYSLTRVSEASALECRLSSRALRSGPAHLTFDLRTQWWGATVRSTSLSEQTTFRGQAASISPNPSSTARPGPSL